MDIHAGIITFTVIILIIAYFILRNGMRVIRASRGLTYYRLRRERSAEGWRIIFLALFVFALAAWLPFYGEPLAYQYFPPSPTPSRTPTITITPTITLSPTITLTPTITDTPAVTDTPTSTSTPFLPLAIEVLFSSIVTPNPEAVFSQIEFSTDYDGQVAVNPKTIFQNPVGHLYGTFSYNEMIPGVQWTALWLHEGKLVHYETKPWDGTTGGWGYTDWAPQPSEWLPGRYHVILFVGLDWKVIGEFIVEGDPPTPIPSRTPSPTRSATPTRTPTLVPAATLTPIGTSSN